MFDRQPVNINMSVKKILCTLLTWNIIEFENCCMREKHHTYVYTGVDNPKLTQQNFAYSCLEKNIKNLKMTHCNLKEIEGNTFSKLINLEKLTLSDNKLKEIETKTFSRNRNLRLLNLSNNNIKYFNSVIFDTLSKLQILYMNNNNIENLSKDLFSKLYMLLVLDLSNNELTNIDNLFDNNINLKTLYLQNNKLKSIDYHFFYLKSLEILYLNNNELNYIRNNSFTNNTNLQQLYLHNNKIQHLNSNIFNSSIKQLYTYNNKFHCDCYLLQFYNYLQKLPKTSKIGTCFSPSNLKEKYILNLNSTDFQCPNITLTKQYDEDNQRIILTCQIDTLFPNIDVFWLKNDAPIDENSSEMYQIYVPIENIFDDEDSYTCVGKSIKEYKNSVILSMEDLQKVISVYNITENEGTTIQLNCNISSKNIKWMFKIFKLLMESEKYKFEQEKLTLVINKLSIEDTGLYRCRDMFKNEEIHFQVSLKMTKPLITNMQIYMYIAILLAILITLLIILFTLVIWNYKCKKMKNDPQGQDDMEVYYLEDSPCYLSS